MIGLLLCGCSHSSQKASANNETDSLNCNTDTIDKSDHCKPDTLKVPDLGEGIYLMDNDKGRLYSAYSGSGAFRYLANSNGDWRYMWGVDEITNQNDSIGIGVGVEKYVFPKNIDFKYIDKIYNPFPTFTEWINKEYTIIRTRKIYGRLCLEATYPKATIKGAQFLRNWISSIMNEGVNGTDAHNDYKGSNPIGMLNQYYHTFRKGYDDENPKNDSTLWLLHWDKHVLVSLRWISTDGNLATFYIADDSYYGGAHSYYSRHYVTLDLNHKRELSFDDIIKPEKRRYVRQILLKKMEIDYCGDDTPRTDRKYLLYLCKDDEIVKKFTDPNSPIAFNYMMDNYNIYSPAITPQGLVFYFDPYDIDCYAGGNKLYVLSNKEIEECLKPKFQKIRWK